MQADKIPVIDITNELLSSNVIGFDVSSNSSNECNADEEANDKFFDENDYVQHMYLNHFNSVIDCVDADAILTHKFIEDEDRDIHCKEYNPIVQAVNKEGASSSTEEKHAYLRRLYSAVLTKEQLDNPKILSIIEKMRPSQVTPEIIGKLSRI